MLAALRKALPAVSPVSIEKLVAAATAGTFLWLLAHGYVQPVAIYLLELYLSL